VARSFDFSVTVALARGNKAKELCLTSLLLSPSPITFLPIGRPVQPLGSLQPVIHLPYRHSTMDTEVLTCSVCLNGYNSTTQRPFDLGCGHSFCENCIKTSPRSFRYCPECRARASNPHANIALLRLLDALDGTGQQAPPAGKVQGFACWLLVYSC
jgi:hypothetical protein